MKRRQHRAHPPGKRAATLDTAERLRRAIPLLQQGKLDEAEPLLRQILQQNPDHVDALHFLGVLVARRGHHQEGVDLIHRALALNPGYVDACNNLGNLLLAMERPDEAMAAYRRAIEIAPDHANAHANLGMALRRSGQIEEAIAALRQAIALEPRHANAHFHLGKALADQGHYAEAIAGIAGELWIDAKTVADQGHYEEAIAAYREAIGANPAHVSAYQSLGMLLYKLGRGPEATALYQQWLERDPHSSVARHMLAAHSGRDVPQRAADAYVQELFDGMADSFDEHLHKLDYRAPKWIAQTVASVLGTPDRSLAVLDAGCGTGLCCPFLRPYARWLTGVDLSPRMVDRARARGGYDELVVAEMTAFLSERNQAYDLIVSADTLVYFGELKTICSAAAGALRPDGWLAFTVEQWADPAAEPGFHLEPSGRYSHAAPYLRRVLTGAGLTIASLDGVDLRLEGGHPVAGFLVAARKIPPAARADRQSPG